jgi:hypothetical protein
MCWRLAVLLNLEPAIPASYNKAMADCRPLSPSLCFFYGVDLCKLTGPSVLSTHKLAKRFGGWVAWSSGVTRTGSIAVQLHPRRKAAVLGIAVEVCAYKAICVIAVVFGLVRCNRGRFVPVRD